LAQQVTIDFSKIHDTAIRGIDRAAVFLGLGVNAADHGDLTRYQLTNDTNFRILPDEVTPKTLESWKKEFRIWIVGCGFRELIDRLCVFFDRIHKACRVIDQSYTVMAIKKFDFLGLEGKLKTLESEFGVKCPFGIQLASFYPVRNCFVHRLGLVGDPDLKHANSLPLRFMRFDSIFVTSSGEEMTIQDIFDPNSPEFVTPEEGHLGLKWVERRLEFYKNDWISFSPKDLTEILFFTRLCAVEITKSSLKFAKSNGVELDKNAERFVDPND
jgi:hypothetical protein